MSPRTSVLLATGILLLGAAARPSAQVFDPTLRFRTLPTEHFVIHFHQGEDALAQFRAGVANSVQIVQIDVAIEWIGITGDGRTVPL